MIQIFFQSSAQQLTKIAQHAELNFSGDLKRIKVYQLLVQTDPHISPKTWLDLCHRCLSTKQFTDGSTCTVTSNCTQESTRFNAALCDQYLPMRAFSTWILNLWKLKLWQFDWLIKVIGFLGLHQGNPGGSAEHWCDKALPSVLKRALLFVCLCVCVWAVW